MIDDEDDDDVVSTIRRAIGGDTGAISSIKMLADTTDDATVIALAALLEWSNERLDRAQTVASTSRTRQVVAISRAHLAGDHQLVDALARDHLVDYPASFIVAWVASDAVTRARHTGSL